MNEDITSEQVSRFIKTHPKRASIVLSVLAKKRESYKALTSPLGQELCGLVIARMEHLLEKIISGDFSDEERVELKVLRRISGDWADRVSAYQAETEKVRLNKA